MGFPLVWLQDEMFWRKAAPCHKAPWPCSPQAAAERSWKVLPLPALHAPPCSDEKITASPAEQNGSLQNLIWESIQQLNAKIDKLRGALSTGESKLETMSVKII